MLLLRPLGRRMLWRDSRPRGNWILGNLLVLDRRQLITRLISFKRLQEAICFGPCGAKRIQIILGFVHNPACALSKRSKPQSPANSW